MNDRVNVDVDAEFRRILSGLNDMTADMRALDARLDERHKLNAIVIAYDRAREDPQFKCPSYLMAVIEAARS